MLCLLALWLAMPAGAAQRVISLAPNATELAYAAGMGDVLVAASAYSDYPPQAAKLEQVASWQGINLERVLALKPDLILAWRGGNPQRVLDQLAAFGIPIFYADADTLEGIAGLLDKLAQYSPHPEQAHQAAEGLRRQFAALKQQYAANPSRRVLLQFGTQPLFTSAGATLQSQVLALCGGQNVFADSRTLGRRSAASRCWRASRRPSSSPGRERSRQCESFLGPAAAGAGDRAERRLVQPRRAAHCVGGAAAVPPIGGDPLMLVFWLDILGTAVFAVSGVLLAGKLRMDPFGVLVLGVVTAVGGGTIRDMALANGPVFWVRIHRSGGGDDHLRLDAAAGAPAAPSAEVGAAGAGRRRAGGVRRHRRQQGLRGRHRPAGGNLHGSDHRRRRRHYPRRAGARIPMILRTEIYATACIIGGIVHATAFYTFHMPLQQAMMLGMIITLAIRLAAIRWHLKLPAFILER